MTYKSLFSRALSAAPGRLHFAAHSHHLWPDASFEAQQQTWLDANLHADHKWDLVFGQVIPEAQAHVAAELALPSPDSIVFSSNTHDFLLRLFSGVETKPVRILATDGDHSFRRQAERWEEVGAALVTRVPLAPFDTFADRFIAEASKGGYDWIVVSQVFFRTGGLFDRIEELAALARPEGPWVLIDGYHGFMATPTDLSAVADRVFYVSGGYKYAMSGEGVCFLHAPPGFCPRPVVTGWFAEFGDLSGPPGGVQYRSDGGRFWAPPSTARRCIASTPCAECWISSGWTPPPSPPMLAIWRPNSSRPFKPDRPVCWRRPKSSIRSRAKRRAPVSSPCVIPTPRPCAPVCGRRTSSPMCVTTSSASASACIRTPRTSIA